LYLRDLQILFQQKTGKLEEIRARFVYGRKIMQIYPVSTQLYITGKAIYMFLQMMVAVLRLITRI
jgi:hypothetical protein